MICDRRIAAGMERKVDGTETCHGVWFAYGYTDKKTGGEAGGGKVEHVECIRGTECDGGR